MMKLLIISALVSLAAAGTVPEVQIKSIVLPEPAIPNQQSYIPRPEPISFGMIMVPQEVLDAIAAEEQLNVEHSVEPVDSDSVKFVDNIEIEPVQVADMPVFEPISAGELETIRVAMPNFNEASNAVESVIVVDTPKEQVEMNKESVKIVDGSLSGIPVQYPSFRYDDPYLR